MNEQKIAILTDSCADLPASLVRKHPIYVVPLLLRFSDGEFAAGIDITPDEVYRRLPQEMPQTTLPRGETVEQTFRAIREAGYTKVLAIHFSSGLSGTYNMVRVIGEQTVGLEVVAFDTRSASLGTGMTVMQAARWIEQGRSFTQICHALPQLMRRTWVYFCVDTLEYLRKGGRIGKVAAIAGTLLQIKPIISFTAEGELVSVAKVRGRKAALAQMADMVTAHVPRGVQFHLAVANGGCPDEMRAMRSVVERALPDHLSCLEGEIDCTLAAYVGPQLLGVGVQLVDDDLFVEK